MKLNTTNRRRFTLAAILFAVVALTITCSSNLSNSAKRDFIKIQNGQLIKDGKPYYFVGVNFWYGAILASQGEGGNRNRLCEELDILECLGVDNLRILVGADGENGLPSRVRPTLQTAPGIYNDTILDGLDYLMAELSKRNMHAVLYLNNSWEWSGGYSVYLQWSGHGRAPIPSVDGWPTYMEYVKQYMQSDSAKALFDNHVRFILGRTNRYTNTPYTEDTAILSWQIGNEPRCFADENKDAFAEWTSHVATLIKQLDNNHLVSLGSEGKHGCEQDLELYERINSDANIDYLNIHIWPYNWGWVSQETLLENLEQAKSNTSDYIAQHYAIAEKYNKPIILEEFGYPRDDFKFARNTSTKARDEYYQFVFQRIIDEASKGGLFAGCNCWAWGGTAKPSTEHIFWELGDDYTGDPAQEEQGLNSVFHNDSTVALIRHANETLHEIVAK